MFPDHQKTFSPNKQVAYSQVGQTESEISKQSINYNTYKNSNILWESESGCVKQYTAVLCNMPKSEVLA